MNCYAELFVDSHEWTERRSGNLCDSIRVVCYCLRGWASSICFAQQKWTPHDKMAAPWCRIAQEFFTFLTLFHALVACSVLHRIQLWQFGTESAPSFSLPFALNPNPSAPPLDLSNLCR